MLFGLKLIFTDAATEATNERLFPPSKHRSKRIHKKLVKRFGGEFRKVPAMYKMGNTVYCHPAMKPRLDAALKHQPRHGMTG